MKFHDGTPFTSAAVKASFDRRLAVNQGPAYMVQDVDSVTTQGDYGVTITLKGWKWSDGETVDASAVIFWQIYMLTRRLWMAIGLHGALGTT